MASNRGFASMSPRQRHQAAVRGGRASSGKFKTGDKRTILMARRGAIAQPLAGKSLGGKNSHRSRSS